MKTIENALGISIWLVSIIALSQFVSFKISRDISKYSENDNLKESELLGLLKSKMPNNSWIIISSEELGPCRYNDNYKYLIIKRHNKICIKVLFEGDNND